MLNFKSTHSIRLPAQLRQKLKHESQHAAPPKGRRKVTRNSVIIAALERSLFSAEERRQAARYATDNHPGQADYPRRSKGGRP